MSIDRFRREVCFLRAHGDSRRESNGKTKGVGNRKWRHKHLSWAFH